MPRPSGTGSKKSAAPSTPRKNTKITGERSEAAFLARALDFGFGIAKPWGDSRRYDFILDNGECLHRIQVKCTECIRADAYETRATYTTGKGRAIYTKKDIDFLAAHVVPLNIWYLVPVEICTPQPMLRFYPHRQAKIMRLEPYREAWHLILPRESNHVMEIHACADPRYEFDSGNSDPISNDPMSDDLNSDDLMSNVLNSKPRTKPQPAKLLDHYRELCQKTPATKVDPSLAPWPIPRLKILATKKGKHLLPDS